MRRIEDQLAELETAHLMRRLNTFTSPQGPTLKAGSMELANFSSNDYLGLASSRVLRETLKENIDRWGAGSGGSRLVCGTLSPHADLEEQLATFKDAEAALCFSSGYAAALGVTTSIASGKNDIIILDKLCHASLIDGARLSGATIRVYPHNDLVKLEDHLRWAQKKITSDCARILVATEGIFSMDGDVSPLREIVDLKEKYGALLILDEAHSFGVLGPSGRGLAAELNLSGRIDFNLGTLSKAVGLSGGFVAASRASIDLLINCSRSFIYSTAPPPAIAATASKSIEIIGSAAGDSLRTSLHKNVSRIGNILREKPSSSAILPKIIGDESSAVTLSQSLRENGVLAPAIRYPTVALGKARLRFVASAAHSEPQFAKLTQALEVAANLAVAK